MHRGETNRSTRCMLVCVMPEPIKTALTILMYHKQTRNSWDTSASAAKRQAPVAQEKEQDLKRVRMIGLPFVPSLSLDERYGPKKF